MSMREMYQETVKRREALRGEDLKGDIEEMIYEKAEAGGVLEPDLRLGKARLLREEGAREAALEELAVLLEHFDATMVTGVNLAMLLCVWANRGMPLGQLTRKAVDCATIAETARDQDDRA